MILFLFYAIITLASLYISYYMLEVDETFFRFLLIAKKALIKSIFVFFLPKFIHYLIIGPTSLIISFDLFIFEICFFTMIITDFFDKSIFTIIPFILIGWKSLFFILIGAYDSIFWSCILAFFIFVIYRTLNDIFFFFLNKESIGFGDILCLWVFSFYTDSIGLIVTFWLASLLGLLKTLVSKLIWLRSPINSEIPFVPYLYLGYQTMLSLMTFKYVYNFFSM